MTVELIYSRASLTIIQGLPLRFLTGNRNGSQHLRTNCPPEVSHISVGIPVKIYRDKGKDQYP